RSARPTVTSGTLPRLHGALIVLPLSRNRALQQTLLNLRRAHADPVGRGRRATPAGLYASPRGPNNQDAQVGSPHRDRDLRGKALVGHHVGLIDNHDAVAGSRRCVIRALTQLTHIFYRVVRRRIQPRDIQVARATWG